MNLQQSSYFFLVFSCLCACWSCDSGAVAPKAEAALYTGGGIADTIPPGQETKSGKMDKADDLYHFEEADGVVPPAGAASPYIVQYLMGQFDPAKRSDFVSVGKPYSDLDNMMLRKETFESFRKMWAAAKRDGIELKIISSTRNFERQKAIWEGKWTRFAQDAPEPEARALKILEYSSMPGSSRHHWGTDIDLNDLENKSFEPGGKYEKVYQWLQKHAHEYGFCQPYTPKGAARPNGYNEEKWHWSYMPLSQSFTAQYRNYISDDMITGFQGAETAISIRIVENYVLGINQDCLK